MHYTILLTGRIQANGKNLSFSSFQVHAKILSSRLPHLQSPYEMIAEVCSTLLRIPYLLLRKKTSQFRVYIE